jgi:hypothetical protein
LVDNAETCITLLLNPIFLGQRLLKKIVQVLIEVGVVRRSGTAFMVDRNEKCFGRMLVQPGVIAIKDVFDRSIRGKKCLSCTDVFNCDKEAGVE